MVGLLDKLYAQQISPHGKVHRQYYIIAVVKNAGGRKPRWKNMTEISCRR